MWSKVLKKLRVAQLVRKLLTSYKDRKFITAFTKSFPLSHILAT
jgi:hypothetical protein